MTEELFSLFDPDEDVEIGKRNLPHWQQAGKTYFITFRTADSIPRAVIDGWYQDRADWLKRHGIDSRDLDWKNAFSKLPAKVQRDFRHTFCERFQNYLDECHGECVLRRPDLAEIIGNSLLHFNGARYELSDFVVMPNHVHTLVQMLPPTDMTNQCTSWKHFTAAAVHRALGRTGHFWQDESFDHLVRSPEQFEATRRYMAENPRKAKLRPGEYLHFARRLPSRSVG